MKAKPVKLVYGEGYKPCSVEDATHITLRFPGPTGLLTLPVIRSGTREGTGCWTWNGSTDAPTLRPSVQTQGRACDDDLNDLGPFTCHSWVNDGQAQFLADSTHQFAGQTVDLLPVDGAAGAGQQEGGRMQKLIARGEVAPASKQLTKACSDCPLRRDALRGWLGGSTPEEYARLCHSDAVVECHVHAGSRCAGLAIYRSNTCKWQPPEHALAADHEGVFSNMMQFLAHHNGRAVPRGVAP